MNDVIENTVSVLSGDLTLTYQINLKDTEKHCGNNLVFTQTDKFVRNSDELKHVEVDGKVIK